MPAAQVDLGTPNASITSFGKKSCGNARRVIASTAQKRLEGNAHLAVMAYQTYLVHVVDRLISVVGLSCIPIT